MGQVTMRFGTEGWRGIMADEVTVERLQLVAQAVAEHVVTTGQGRRPLRVVVGHDTRFLSDYFARAVSEVLVGNGLGVVLSDRAVPTCAVSRAVVARRLPAGLMITASHNPAIYNGVKVKEAYGGSATTETVASIERRLGRSRIKRLSFDHAVQEGAVVRENLMPAFLDGIRGAVDLAAIRRSAFRVIVDPMHGTAGRTIERLLSGGRCRVETIRAWADPLFGGQPPEPIAIHLGELRRVVRATSADLGIATDGDADRVGAVGAGGTWVNPGQVMCILLEHLVETRRLHGAVVKTISNTMMINRMTAALGLRLVEVPVGFKHVAKRLLEDQVLIGGEESGGIGVAGYLPERDGILNGLLLLEAMAVRRKGFSVILRELERRYGRWHYGRRDLSLSQRQVNGLFKRLDASPPDRMAGVPVARVDRLDGVKLIGRDESWLLFRRSGTEPIIRVYAETPRSDQLSRLLDFGTRLAKQHP